MKLKKVGSYEAKTHFPALLDSVSQGERIIITRKGVPIAILIPYKDQQMTVDDAINAIVNFRKKLNLKGLSIREMREEGRK